MKNLKVRIEDTNEKKLENLEFASYKEAEDYVYGKYNSCWNIEKHNDETYTFIVYAL